MTDATVLLHRFTGTTYDDLYRLAPVDMWARVDALSASIAEFREVADDGNEGSMPLSM